MRAVDASGYAHYDDMCELKDDGYQRDAAGQFMYLRQKASVVAHRYFVRHSITFSLIGDGTGP